MEEYKEIKELLKPRRDIQASDELRLKVIRAVEGKNRKQVVRKYASSG